MENRIRMLDLIKFLTNVIFFALMYFSFLYLIELSIIRSVARAVTSISYEFLKIYHYYTQL
jgi:hypothetical protein